MCLVNLEASYSSVGYNDIVINKVVTGIYQGGPNLKKAQNIELLNTKEENNFSLLNLKKAMSADAEKQEKKRLEELKKVEVEKQKAKEPMGRPIKAELTAYSNDPRDSEEWGSQTAMQTRTKLGVIAAPTNIPLGSKMYIPELKNYKADGIFRVEDRGGAIKIKKDGTYVIDVWVSSYQEAVKFGRKKTTIYLME